jgi:hypothetical protein
MLLTPWRPVDRRSRMQTYIKYGRRGLGRGDHRMGLAYGLRAVGQVPWRSAGWRLLVRALQSALASALRNPSPRAPADDAKP